MDDKVKLKETREFREGDVWLCKWGDGLSKFIIKRVINGQLQISGVIGWCGPKYFNSKAVTRLGRAYKMFGIYFGCKYEK